MALPQQLKAARMTDSTLVANVDNEVGNLEKALADIFGFTADVNITESPLSCDNSGRICKQLLRLAAAATMGIRFRDTTNSTEFRIALNNTSITLDANIGSEGSPSWSNRININLSTGAVTFKNSLTIDPTGDDAEVLLYGDSGYSAGMRMYANGGTTNYWAVVMSTGAGLNFNYYDGSSHTALMFSSARVGTFEQVPKAPGFRATTDAGGEAGTVTLVDAYNMDANSSGIGTIKMKGTTSRDSAAFLKVYIGTTAYYVPLFSAITG